jgi:hypothetical protein
MTQLDSEQSEVIDEAGATAALTAARRALRDLISEHRELQHRAHGAVHEALRYRKMVEALDKHKIPDDHRPRLISEMSALGKAADFDEHVRDYKTAFIDTNGGDA